MIGMRNESSNMKNPKLPIYMPKTKPDRMHALPKNALYTIQNLSNIVVFLWLKNGTGFWYYVSYSTKDYLVGYIWNGKHWTRREIHINLIVAYY